MKLTTVPDQLLKKTCEKLKASDLKAGTYAALIEQMKKAMVENQGIGLAANQAGEDLALFVIDEALALEQKVPSVYANPEITEHGREKDQLEEGCLSIPGYWIDIKRSKKVMFKALGADGTKVKFRARGLLARVLQHETDHLNGITIQDRSEKKK